MIYEYACWSRLMQMFEYYDVKIILMVIEMLNMSLSKLAHGSIAILNQHIPKVFLFEFWILNLLNFIKCIYIGRSSWVIEI